jgi:FixJ family two-component response regulator
MSGLEVQGQLSRMSGRIATTFITAHDRPAAQQECLAAGAVAYLRKPVDGKTLLSTVQQALSITLHHRP